MQFWIALFPNWSLQPCFENHFVNQYLSLVCSLVIPPSFILFPLLLHLIQIFFVSTPHLSSFPPYVEVLSIVQSKPLPLAPLAEPTVRYYRTSLIPLSCQSREGKHRERPRKGKRDELRRKYLSYYTSNISTVLSLTHTYKAWAKLTLGFLTFALEYLAN